MACSWRAFAAEEPVRIGTVTIQGNHLIRESSIRRELDFKPNAPFTDNGLYEAYQRLYLTGYFDQVDVSTQAAAGRHVDIHLRVRERPTRFVKGGVGYGTETKEKASVGMEDRYFLGTPTSLDFTVTHSGFLTHPDKYRTTLINLKLYTPHIFNSHWDGQTEVAREYRNREAYNSTTTAWRSSIGRKWGSFLMQMRYRFQGDRIYNARPEADTVDNVDISAVGPVVTYDTTDDPFLPGRGWRVTSLYEQGMTLGVGDLSFNRLETRAGRFQPIPGGWTGFGGIQGGAIRPQNSSDTIPITERYFIGGANTVRGYDERELGPHDLAGAPIGGEAFLAMNLEMRHRIYKAVHGLVFLDGGQLYTTDLGRTWPHVRLEQLDDLQYAAGTGIRWNTPLGALRFESGYALNRPQGGDFWNRLAFHFSIGEAF